MALGGGAAEASSSSGALAEVIGGWDENAVDLVMTGDREMDDSTQALVRAVREALANAVRHGRPPVSVYVEAGPAGVEAFIRDHGPGLDLDDSGPARRAEVVDHRPDDAARQGGLLAPPRSGHRMEPHLLQEPT